MSIDRGGRNNNRGIYIPDLVHRQIWAERLQDRVARSVLPEGIRGEAMRVYRIRFDPDVVPALDDGRTVTITESGRVTLLAMIGGNNRVALLPSNWMTYDRARLTWPAGVLDIDLVDLETQSTATFTGTGTSTRTLTWDARTETLTLDGDEIITAEIYDGRMQIVSAAGETNRTRRRFLDLLIRE